MFWGLNALQVTQEPVILKEQVMVTSLSQETLCVGSQNDETLHSHSGAGPQS